MSEYIVSQTLGYGNTINVLYCSEECAALYDYNVPSYVCGTRIELNRFLDNFALVQDNKFTAIYEARYESATIYYNKITGEYELNVLGENHKAIHFNELIVIMDKFNIGWNEHEQP